MDHYQFLFEAKEESQKDILVALLANIGFEGFEEEGDQLKAFVPIDNFDKNEFNFIIEQNNINYSKSIIKQTNWNEKWESGFEPVVVPDPLSGHPFVAVRANFHSAITAVVHDLVITPKMSFGTGHHATTYLMIQQMALLDCKGKTVLDFGTGTAVLAILAEKLGASAVIAIDNDDWSISNAKENIEANGCKQIELQKADTIEPGIKADIILANINLNIIIANINAIKAACVEGNSILFSGIMTKDKEQIFAVLNAYNFIIKEVRTRDNWLIILANG